LTSIGDYAFSAGYDNDSYNTVPITTITIPASVTSIGDAAFYRNTTLTTVTFESGSQLTSIGNHAFFNCTSLTTITIPASVTSIGNQAFFNCISLTTVYISSNNVLEIATGNSISFYGANTVNVVYID
jgi:hypothetical protein